MKPALFDYIRPDSLEDTLAVLGENEDATIIAGGQSLLPMLNLRVTSAETLVDISRLQELTNVCDHGDHVSIGTLVTHASIEDGLGREAFSGLLQRVASGIAYRAVRNMGTIGGSLALCDPSADWPACLLALGATVDIASTSGERRVGMKNFLVDAYTTALEPGEILVGVDIPKRAEGGWGVGKVARKRGAFADSLAVAVLAPEDRHMQVALAGTASCAKLLARTGQLLVDNPRAGTDDLSSTIMQDIAHVHDEATPYQQRCHLYTVMSAISEARQWSR